MIWREKRILLIILAVLLAANTIFFFTYRVQYENRLRELDARRDAVRGELEAARRTRLAAEQQVAGYRKVEKDVRQIYDAEWSTQSQRLTLFISEVMRLGVASQLVPKSYSFTGSTSSKANKAAGSYATEVGMAFTVEGTYQQVRRLINLMEVSDQFVIIDQIGLTSENGEKLTMTIRVKTLFRDTSGASKGANQEL